MLYVFLVDTGRMMTLDMNLALENVSVLKEVIQRAVKVPPEKQVLLISGGEELRPDMRVCQYTAGTDTNPIFLFFLTTIEGQTPPSPSIDYGADTDLKEQVEGALNMPASYNTVVARAQLAQQFHEHSRDQTRICQQLVHDQHLQQQGWAAVVANLEDLVSDFKKTFQSCEQSFNDFFKSREEKFSIIENFDEDLKLLSRIPVLPALLANKQIMATISVDTSNDDSTKESETDEEVSSSIKEEIPTAMTLLEWISASDTKSSVEEIAQICLRGLQQTDQHMLEVLAGDVKAVMTEADRPQMKEIKGLEDRLFGLEQLMHDANKIVQEQNSFAQALIQNQNRAGKMNDQSIFPDLCSSHRKNLMHMLKNHQKVQDIKRRCIKAKEELSENLHHRLKWIMYIERKISYTSSKLMMHHEAIRRLTSSLQVMEQIHRAPRMYVSAITEVARRHQFSKSFVQWATHLSVESGDVWEREVSTRKQFLQQFSQHFLVSLFPGLDDLPPNFATQAPDKFDDTLPKLTPENIEDLRKILPELASLLVLGEVAAVPPLLQAAMRTQNALPNRKLSRESNSSSLTLGKEGSGEVFASAFTTTNSVTPRITPDRDSHYTAKPLTHRPYTLSREHSEVAICESEEAHHPAEDDSGSPMEVRSDTRTMKTKHHFPAIETDNKQMKLDQGQDTARIKLDTDLHQRPCRSQHHHHHLSSVSPQENPLIQSPESQQELCEFVTAEFYIDESMPSSYTESNDAASDITASSSRGLPGHGSNMVKTHHVITAELQRQLEEKNVALLLLQSELTDSQSEVERLSERLNALSTLDCKDQVVNLKDELSRLRLQVKEDGTSYMKYLSESSSNLLDVLLQIQNRSSTSEKTAVQEALVAARANQEALQKELQATVELQAHKLTDATREVEVYQEQIHRHQETIQQQSTEFEEAKRQLMEDKVEITKQLTLEHELEMVTLKEHMQEDDNAHQDELGKLTEKLTSLEISLEKAENDRASLEKNFQEKFEAHFQEEKDKIVQILEVSFTEREKKALDSLREQLVQEQQDHVNRLLTEKEELLKSEISSVQSALSAEWQSKVDQQWQELMDMHQKQITKMQLSWEQEKDVLITAKLAEVEKQFGIEKDAEVENVRQQYKMELEGLRSRFRMMTTASCDKSPSETSLQSLERMERADSVDLGTHEAALARLREELHREHSAALEAERQLLEQQHFQQHQEADKKHQEIINQQRKRIESEKQTVFNDAIRCVSQDKERVIEDLRLRIELLTDETEKLRRMMNAAATDSSDQIMQAMAAENHSLKERCETLHKEVVRLENELLRAKRMSFVCERQQDLNASFTEGAVGGVQVPTSPESVRKLQLENQELRDKLSRSTSSLVERGRISISSCVQGEAVLLVWDEIHLHYRVLLEGHPHLHFLHSDSYQALGLHKGDATPDTPRKMYVTAEVVSKEFCQAKKDENRFRVPKGTRFYRVQAKLWEGEEKARRETTRDQNRDQLTQSQVHAKEQQSLNQSQTSSHQ
ncbi:unnamed protein product [Meganyctiphanes norvegica]|uniref:RB1-inducible coiled-coil protein 1 n=1 Tax=Meganyctiphanes norvegica TaxID=48144 RepID=A0AAV2Q797_MEGNR